MSFLTIISESGFPHAACLMEHSEAEQQWYGWLPGPNTTFFGTIGPGHLDDQSREANIARFARFEVPAATLVKTEERLLTKYTDGSGYTLEDRDCIGLVWDVCHWSGLFVPPIRHFYLALQFDLLPVEVVWKTAVLNWGSCTHFGTDSDQPYPWNVCSV
jgi:hypothetical protein